MDGLMVMGVVCAVGVAAVLLAYATRRRPRPPRGAEPAGDAPPPPFPTTREGGDAGGR